MTSGVLIEKEEKEAAKQKALDYFDKAVAGTFTGAFAHAGIAYSVGYKWMEEDPIWKKKMILARELSDDRGGDFAEAKLMQHIQRDSLRATTFYLERKHRARGYAPLQMITGKDEGPIEIEHTGDIVDSSLDRLRELARKRDG